ncbi:MAG: ankyrin repeat domain-containing protein [Pirellulales bacterium]
MISKTKASIALATLFSLSVPCSNIQAQQAASEKQSSKTKVDQPTKDDGKAEQLWAAARTGDIATITKLLDAGVDVNSATHYNSTVALSFACDRGHVEVVTAAQAWCQSQRTRYLQGNADWAMMNGHYDVLSTLIGEGAKGA